MSDMTTSLPPQSSTALAINALVGLLILHPHSALVNPHFTNTECAARRERLVLHGTNHRLHQPSALAGWLRTDDSGYSGHINIFVTLSLRGTGSEMAGEFSPIIRRAHLQECVGHRRGNVASQTSMESQP
jgi:hypothetical protein